MASRLSGTLMHGTNRSSGICASPRWLLHWSRMRRNVLQALTLQRRDCGFSLPSLDFSRLRDLINTHLIPLLRKLPTLDTKGQVSL